MNTLFGFNGVAWWQVAGWTMVHFLWLGALVGVLAAACHLVLRRAAPNVRYIAAVASLGILTVLPIGIAAWLVSTGPATQVTAASDGGAVFEAGSEQLGARSQKERTIFDLATIPLHNESGDVIDLSDRQPAPFPAIEPTRDRMEIVSPGRADGLRVLALLDAAVRFLPWLWIVGTPLTFALLATGLVGTRRMRSASQLIEAGAIVDACRRIARSLGIRRQVAVAVCERIAAPVLVGILRPVILLPPAALLGWSPADVEMVLLHELAHVRRWDNLVNLLQRLVESLLFFHPAVWLVSGWVRREREACCDAIVVGHTQQPRAYAELLVSIAARLPRGAMFAPATASAMAAGPLRSRIRQILKLEDDPMLVSGKSLALATLVLLVVVPLSAMQLAVGGRADDSATTTGPQVADDLALRNDSGPADGAKEAEATQSASVDAENAVLQLLFEVSDDNPLQTKTYDVPELGRERDRFLNTLQGWQHDRFGPRLKFSTQLTFDKSRVEIRAAEAAHVVIFALWSNEFRSPIPDAASIAANTKAHLAAMPTSLLRGNLAEIDLLLRQIADLQKHESELQSKVLQTRTDYAAALEQLNELTDPNGEQKRALMKKYRTQFNSQMSLAVKSQSRLIDTIAALQGILGKATLLAEQAREAGLAEWEKLIAQMPRIEAVAAVTAWEKLGLKIVPATEHEVNQLDRDLVVTVNQNGRQLPKIVGGNLPKGLPVPAYVVSLGGNSYFSFEKLLDGFLGSDPSSIQCRAVDGEGRKYVFTTQPPLAGAAKPETTTPPELDLARSQIRLENNQLVITLTDAQSQSQTRSRLVGSIDVLDHSAHVRMNGNQITVSGVDDKTLLQIRDLIFVAFGSGKLNLGGSTVGMENFAPVTTGLRSAATPAQNVLGSGATRGRTGLGLGAAQIRIREGGQQLVVSAADANVLKEVEAMVPMLSGSTRVVAGNGELVISNTDPAKLVQIRDFLIQTFNRQAPPNAAAPATPQTPAAADKDSRAPDRAAPARDSREVLRYEGNLVEPLLEWSRDERFQPMRLSILTALVKFHQQTPDKQIEDRLAEAFGDKEYEVARLAIQTLYPVQHTTANQFGRGGRGGRGQAEGGLGGRGRGRGRGGRGPDFAKPQLPETAEYRPELIAAIKHPDGRIRYQTSWVFQALGPKAKAALPDVLPGVLLDVNVEQSAISGGGPLSVIGNVAGTTEGNKMIIEYLDKVIAKGEPADDVEKARLLRRVISNSEESAEKDKEVNDK